MALRAGFEPAIAASTGRCIEPGYATEALKEFRFVAAAGYGVARFGGRLPWTSLSRDKSQAGALDTATLNGFVLIGPSEGGYYTIPV